MQCDVCMCECVVCVHVRVCACARECVKLLCACECVSYYMVYVNVCKYVPCVQYAHADNNDDDDVNEFSGNSNSNCIYVLYYQRFYVYKK